MEVKRIWDKAPHNAFTDLIRFKDKFFCAFREGQKHMGDVGIVRVIMSEDGEQWRSVAELAMEGKDLRDAKLSITPTGELMLNTCMVLFQNTNTDAHSLAYFSSDGFTWSKATAIGQPQYWLWRTDWHKGVGYSIGYSCGSNRHVRLYKTNDGKHYDVLVETLFDQCGPSEYALVFLEDDTCLCLLRRDEPVESGKDNGLLGKALPPYTDWEWQDLGVKIGGPDMIQLPDGRIMAAVRKLKDNSVKEWWLQWTELCWVDIDKAELTPYLKLPSGGDSSYPGLIRFEGQLWVSYYSSHEEKTAIYLAKVEIN